MRSFSPALRPQAGAYSCSCILPQSTLKSGLVVAERAPLDCRLPTAVLVLTGVATSAVVSSAGDITINPAKVSVTSTWQPGDPVTVQASYPYSISLLGFVVASGNLTSKTTERVE